MFDRDKRARDCGGQVVGVSTGWSTPCQRPSGRQGGLEDRIRCKSDIILEFGPSKTF